MASSGIESVNDKQPTQKKRIGPLFQSLEVKLFLFVSFVLSLTVLPFSSPNEKSRFALAIAILFDHSFAITNYSKFVGIDVSPFHGVIYSTMAPGLSFLLIFPLALGTLFGDLANSSLAVFGVGGSAAPSQVVAVQLFSSLCTALSAVYLYKLCLALDSRKYPALAAALIYVFATPIWVFGKTEFAHTYSALFLVMAYYYALRNPKLPSTKDGLLAGVFSAVALSIEYTNVVLILPGMIYLLVKWGKADGGGAVKKTLIFSAPLVVSGILLLLYNYVLFQDPLIFPESYWKGYKGHVIPTLGQFSTPLFTGLQGLLISPARGLIVFSPIVLLALPGFYLLARKHRWETLILASVFLANLLMYSQWYSWNGGGSYGPRFIVPSIPFLIIPIFALIEGIMQNRSTIIKVLGAIGTTALFVASVAIESIGAITSAVAGYSSNVSFVNFLYKDTSFPSILSGNLRDLAYVLLFNPMPSSLTLRADLGWAFWIAIIVIPTLAFLYALKASSSKIKVIEVERDSKPPVVIMPASSQSSAV